MDKDFTVKKTCAENVQIFILNKGKRMWHSERISSREMMLERNYGNLRWSSPS